MLVERATPGVATRAENVLRLVAGAAGAVRLYPPASPLRSQAIHRFTEGASAVTAHSGPLQFRVDRDRFLVGDVPVGETVPQIAALAETLHALQVGQLIIAPGFSDEEAGRFLDLISGDARAIRESGGLRARLLESGVANLAVIEVTLRASTEEGVLGLDLAAAPLEDIADGLADAGRRWAETAGRGAEATDLVAEAIGRLEPAARELATARCAEALRFLDEDTRTSLLNAALTESGSGERMEGMLAVIARMPPAALARLLRLAALSSGRDPASMLDQVAFPPEVLAELAALLRPAPRTDRECGVPEESNAEAMAGDVAASGEADYAHLRSLIQAATPRDRAARGLSMTMRMAEETPSPESVQAMVEAITPALREGAFDEALSASAVLDALAADPSLGGVIAAGRAALTSPESLTACAIRLAAEPEAESARILLETAGAPGAEALVTAYLQASEMQRARLLPAAGAMTEALGPVAGRILRSGDAASAAAVARLLGSIGSRRLLPTLALGLENLDERVRQASLAAVADTPGAERSQLLQGALGHWDPDTRRYAAREIGRARAAEAVPALMRLVASTKLFERDHELKKEALRSLETLHSTEAVPALTRLASRKLVVGKKNRELRYLARRVLESIERADASNRKELEP